MELNVDTLILIYEKYTTTQKVEVDEQDAAPAGGATTSGGGGSSSSVPKWADLYSIKRGKANMLGKSGEKWNTGLNRGVANQIW
jgi:hypothetical protein